MLKHRAQAKQIATQRHLISLAIGSELWHHKLASHLFRYIAGVLLILILQALPFESSARVNQTTLPRLEIGKPIQTTISAGERHSYLIGTTGNLFVELTVNQRAVDLIFPLFTDGIKLVDADRTKSYEPETIIGIMGPAGGIPR